MKEVAFLDTLVKISQDRLITDLYKTPTDTTNYLMHKSAHPSGCKKGAYSQYLRLRRNCSTVTDYDKHSTNLTDAYISRGYDESELTESQKTVKNRHRSDLLQPKQKDPQDNALVCTLPYNLHNVDARKIITENWHILSESAHLNELFKDHPIFGYTRPKNYKDSLCRAAIRYPPDTADTIDALNYIYESDPCTHRECKWCHKISHNKCVK
eukprot:GHVU01163002.1.p1 GENE.GHVU01163002.1~~GHVU01163002.1.p1  ORF type:complete len:211 (+),score=5.62 GHVU01163002.1:455-1087(+)